MRRGRRPATARTGVIAVGNMAGLLLAPLLTMFRGLLSWAVGDWRTGGGLK